MGSGQSIFMTGCASGIGKHVCGRLLKRGDTVFATDINHAALEAVSKQDGWPADRVHVRALDVRDHAAVSAAFAEAISTMGQVDICMNIAGILKANWIQNVPPEEIHGQLDINVKGVMNGTTIAAKYMIGRRQGHIVNIASMASLAPIPGLSVYSASKFAVRGFSMAAAAELKQYNVFVSTLCPHGVQTPLVDLPKENDAASIIWSGGPKLLTVEDVGRAVIEHVLVKKPIIYSFPKHWAFVARISDLVPGMSSVLLPMMQKRGREHRFAKEEHQH